MGRSVYRLCTGRGPTRRLSSARSPSLRRMGPWWRDGVVYQVYPRSFCDTDGDGIGELEGIRRHLPHLVDLGVDALWLSPVFPSPMADFGYDVSDYCDIDPLFGDLSEFDRLVDETHRQGLRVILDWVPNHTSAEHPWFVASRSSRDHPKRNWYIWRDPAPDGGPPNNWVCAFSPPDPAWTFDEATGQYYLHLFLAEQPDLNWSNPDVEQAMHDVLRFWLDRGIDGFRMDVVHCIGKNPELVDDPPDLAGLPRCILHHDEETHPLLRRIRTLVEGYQGARPGLGDVVILGETALFDTTLVGTYYGHGDELHLAFNFVPLQTPWSASAWRRQIEVAAEVFDPLDAWPTWVLSNHDNPRHRSRYGTEARARAAAVLLLTLRGTPCLYAGEELGLADAAVPPERVVDPGGRDGCRAPFPWNADAMHGWAGEPWLPWPPDAERCNVEVERADGDSMLHLYQRLLGLRRTSAALREGELRLLDLPEPCLGYRRSLPDRELLVLVNFGEAPIEIGLVGTVEVSTDRRREGDPFDGMLAGDEAVVLRP